MNRHTISLKTSAKAGILAALLVGLTMVAFSPMAFSHEADCPFCKLKLVQNTDKMDNEVVLMYGNKRIEYRCVYCVFADAGRYKGDLTVQAPSEKKGAPITLKRTAGVWSAPDSTVFLSSFKRHKTCAAESRAFTSRAALETYAKANSIADVKVLTLAEELAHVAKKTKQDAAAPAEEKEEHHDEHHDDSTHHDDDHGSL